MSNTKPGYVICAVRGGRESRDTVSHAIELALETGAHLTFFHVLDAEFVAHATVGPLRLVYRELVEMGEFAMLILCDRARRRGVEHVDYIVREGNIRKQLHIFAQETQAEIMVMGQPTRSPGRNIFRLDEFQAFVDELEGEGNLQIIMVAPSQSNRA
jgi:nucleotide-binding universal stress UspA family protein